MDFLNGRLQVFLGPQENGAPDNLEQIIIQFIDDAQHSLDVAVQEIDNPRIAAALDRASRRIRPGMTTRLRVRFITEGDYLCEEKPIDLFRCSFQPGHQPPAPLATDAWSDPGEDRFQPQDLPSEVRDSQRRGDPRRGPDWLGEFHGHGHPPEPEPHGHLPPRRDRDPPTRPSSTSCGRGSSGRSPKATTNDLCLGLQQGSACEAGV
jgi:hypothetical protein